jgi:PAS domain S-box-containing protein
LEERVKFRTAELEAEIEARKKMEETLRESETRFKLLVENIQDYAIFMLDPEGRVVTWNAGAQRLKGYSAEDIIGKHFSCFYPLDGLETSKHELAIAAKDGHFAGEGWRVRKDGSYFWASVTITALREENGSLRGYAKITRDITERKKAEEALQDSEKRYRRLFESAKDGILILDAHTGKVVDVNPFLLQLLGYSYDELYGQHIWELGVFKDITASQDAFKALQENEYLRYDDLPLETHDGKAIAVEFVSNVYLVDHSKVVQCNIRDITERKQSEEKLRGSEDRLRLALEAAELGTWELDLTNDIAVRSLRHDQIWGYQEHQPKWGLEIAMRYVLPEDRPLVMEAHTRARETGRLSHENRVVWPDGSIHWIAADGRVEYDSEGRAVRINGVVADITERKRAENQRNSEKPINKKINDTRMRKIT